MIVQRYFLLCLMVMGHSLYAPRVIDPVEQAIVEGTLQDVNRAFEERSVVPSVIRTYKPAGYSKTQYWCSPLHVALYRNCPDIAMWLLENRSTTTLQDPNFDYPLHVAVRSQVSIEIIQKLTELSVQHRHLDERNKSGKSALQEALDVKNLQIIELLRQYGAQEPQES